MIRWRKIKLTSDGKITLEYSTSRDLDWDDFSFTCSQQALPEFYAAFDSLAHHMVEMCELPRQDIQENRVKVRGVSFSYGGENEVMGATLTGIRTLLHSHSPLNLNTPHKASEPYTEGPGDSKALLHDDCVDDLKALCREAERYLNGERQQVDLFNPEPETMETR